MTGWRIARSVVTLAVCGLPAAGQAGRPEALTDLNQALQKAAAENKLLFIQMGRPTCGNCMALKNYIRSGQLKLRDTRFVYADLNCDDKTTYQLFRSKFTVEGSMLPFVVVTDPAGRQLVSRAGYGRANEYDDLVDEAEKKMRAAGGPGGGGCDAAGGRHGPDPGRDPGRATGSPHLDVSQRGGLGRNPGRGRRRHGHPAETRRRTGQDRTAATQRGGPGLPGRPACRRWL